MSNVSVALCVFLNHIYLEMNLKHLYLFLLWYTEHSKLDVYYVICVVICTVEPLHTTRWSASKQN